MADSLDLITERTGAKEGAIGLANQVAHAVRMGQPESQGALRWWVSDLAVGSTLNKDKGTQLDSPKPSCIPLPPAVRRPGGWLAQSGFDPATHPAPSNPGGTKQLVKGDIFIAPGSTSRGNSAPFQLGAVLALPSRTTTSEVRSIRATSARRFLGP